MATKLLASSNFLLNRDQDPLVYLEPMAYSLQTPQRDLKKVKGKRFAELGEGEMDINTEEKRIKKGMREDVDKNQEFLES